MLKIRKMNFYLLPGKYIIMISLPDRGFVGDGQRAGQAVYRTLRQQYPCGGAY